MQWIHVCVVGPELTTSNLYPLTSVLVKSYVLSCFYYLCLLCAVGGGSDEDSEGEEREEGNQRRLDLTALLVDNR